MAITIQDILIEVETNPSALYIKIEGSSDDYYQYDISKFGDVLYLGFETNDSWSSSIVSNPDDMIINHTSSGTPATTQIEVYIDENTGFTSRTGIIHFYCDSNIDVNITIYLEQLGSI